MVKQLRRHRERHADSRIGWLRAVVTATLLEDVAWLGITGARAGRLMGRTGDGHHRAGRWQNASDLMKPLAIAVAIFALCAGPADARQEALASPTPHFDVAAFFSGRTEGVGRLKVIFRRPRTVHVHGSGNIGASHELLLNQIVEQEGKPATRRTWAISALGDDRYGGSLTGTTAPIRGKVSGNCLHLELKLEGGLTAEQWLYLQPGGRVALNRMSIRKMGIQVARLNETIRKID